MSDIKKRLNDARPNLSNVSPLVYKLTWAFVPMNIMIGIAIAIQKTVAQPPLITEAVDNSIWAVAFLGVAVVLAYALKLNDWKLIKHTMTFALFLKAVWGIALLIQTVRTSGDALGVLAVWLFITYVQAMCLIHFLPPTGVVSDAGRS